MNPWTVARYSPSDWPHVAALLEAWPFKPLTSYGRWPVERLIALCLARADSKLHHPESITWIARFADTVPGFASLRMLQWDTEQIGFSAARLNYLVAVGTYVEQYQVKQALLAAILEYAVEHGIQHLSARLNASDLSGLHVLEQAGFVTVDGILTFTLDLEPGWCAKPSRGIHIRIATPADCEATADLAREVYIYDRFHSDPAIPVERADDLHAAWLRNSCAGQAADAVILAEDDQDLLGFVTCILHRDTQTHLGTLVGAIVLVATKTEARRRGIARTTTLNALEWFRQQDAEVVQVGTQLRNIPASRLYERCGFRLVGSSVSLRKLL